jgi:hypothetical protein
LKNTQQGLKNESVGLLIIGLVELMNGSITYKSKIIKEPNFIYSTIALNEQNTI